MKNDEAIEEPCNSRATTERFLTLVNSIESDFSKLFASLSALRENGEDRSLAISTAQELVGQFDDFSIAVKEQLYDFIEFPDGKPDSEESSQSNLTVVADLDFESILSSCSAIEIRQDETENRASVDQEEDSVDQPAEVDQGEGSVDQTEENDENRSDNEGNCAPKEEVLEGNKNSPKKSSDSDIEVLEVIKHTPKKKEERKRKNKRSSKETVEKMAKKRRTIESSSEEEMNGNGNDSDGSVIDDEDLELQAQIKKEKDAKRASKRPPKKEKQPKKGTRSRKKADEADKANRLAEKLLDQEDDDDEELDETMEEEEEEEEEVVPRRASRSRAAKNGSSSKSKGKGKNDVVMLDSDEDDVPQTKKSRSKKAKDEEEDEDEIDDEEEKEEEEEDEAYEENESDEEILRENRRLTRRARVVDSEESNGDAKEKKTKRKRATIESDDEGSGSGETSARKRNTEKTKKRKAEISGSEEEEEVNEEKKKSPEKKKKKKGLLGKADLAQETIDAEKAEKERRKRLEKKQKEFNGIEMAEGPDLASALTGAQKGVFLKSVCLDPDKNSDPPVPVNVHPSLVKILKPHQARGIQFMYDSAFESVDRLEESGGGGILAHCMGLGKTLQVIAFLHTIMSHPKISEVVKRVLVVVPKNVVINWYKEFAKWIDDLDEDLAIFEVSELDQFKNNRDRAYALEHWHKSEKPAIMIIGYDMFRILTFDENDRKVGKGKVAPKKNKKFTKLQEEFRQYLQDPGPDLIVCDEAHKLKNDESALSKTMVKIKTKRRICLTGTPLQNNLLEYHCMVNFVKPGLLGTKTEFSNRFANIINRGRTKDATPTEVRFMKRRCHVLYEHLKKCVDRKDYRVLTEAIPPKQEYVIYVRLTKRQIELYKAFLGSIDGQSLSKRLLPDYHVLSRVWTHPYQLVTHEREAERKRILADEAEEDDDFIDDEEEEESGTESEESEKESRGRKKSGGRRRGESESEDDDEDTQIPDSRRTTAAERKSRRLAGEAAPERPQTPPEYIGWFSKAGLVSEEDATDYTLSYKLMLLVDIIKKCEEIGDKILVFSQSLESLSLIKRMLEYLHMNDRWFEDGHTAMNAVGEEWGWSEGLDYLCIDGSVQSGKRDAVQTQFNDIDNLRARLMLISTRAGSLGTNMIAANRVVIFDACWNPSHDTQSLFRVYRFGQTKPVYIYRFIAQGTMEERIYKRQVTKESTSMRVVDEAQIQRHFAGHDLDELYQFDPEDDEEVQRVFKPPADRLLADVLHARKEAIVDCIQHDTLFQNMDDEKLTEEECAEAWNDYEKEKTAPVMSAAYGGYGGARVGLPMPGMGMMGQQMNDVLRAQMMMQQSNNLRGDPIYIGCFGIRGMNHENALKVVYLKRCLDEFMPSIPHHLRGGIHDFAPYFNTLIQEGMNGGHSPVWLLNRTTSIFRTVVKLCLDNVPTLRPTLKRIHANTPQFFDPTAIP
ncbi:hypothetical protein PMAYCL1PPCAC_24573 [Pristionchus mayeri]|uniref:Xnp-1 n=1 Tax=Pristionchus mayeri TaxID=1317129 RepID=A0AAN5D0D1_9BILA|nr:hypothetical protein PMAYCL1PPCAC_24573 [Pristionchus mayeri]